jgi:hypothetical protein
MSTAPIEQTDPSTPAPHGLCTLDAGPVAWAGEPCQACGHTTLAHPGPANPDLVACVICRLLDLALYVSLAIEPWQAQVADRLAVVEAQVAALTPPAS